LTITTAASPDEGGTVTGGGLFASGDTTTLTAKPNIGFYFSKWSDGNIENPRTITVTESATYTAIFVDDDNGAVSLIANAGADSSGVTVDAVIAKGAIAGGKTYSPSKSYTIVKVPQGFGDGSSHAYPDTGKNSLVKLSDGNKIETIR
jgi:hypothetical protein